MLDSKPILLFECKAHNTDLDRQHPTQLYRYFSVLDARFAVLTNGIIYRFFTNLEQANKLDAKPFFEFNMADVTEASVDELKKFTKSAFNLDQNLNAAMELKYTKEIKRIMTEQMSAPSDELVRFFGTQIYTGRMTTQVRQQFSDLTRRALHQFVNERISDRLKSALADDSEAPNAPAGLPFSASSVSGAPKNGDAAPPTRDDRIVTTQDELEAFYIVKSLLREVIDARRVFSRDTIGHYGVLLDDSNRKPICRFRFNGSQRYLGLIDDKKEEERIPLQDLNEIFQYADRLKATVGYYEQVKPADMAVSSDA